ncbi:MAG: leucine-rich repeat domain-containing protein [Treponema sp.]|nr:leucine-rich repeat domain-containing protein [Treponema sp.]
MKRTHTKLFIALLAALLLAAGCGSDDDADTPPTVEYKVMGGRLVWCSGGAEDMAVPGNASSIGNNAFSNCGSIGTLTIPTSVTHIMRYTFSGVKVGKIIFGGTVGEWAAMAEQDGFGETLRGTPVICSDGEWKWTAPAVPVTPDEWEITDGVLIKYSGNAVTVTIPKGVTKIEAGAIPSGTTIIFHGTREEWETLAANSDLGGLTVFAVDEGTLVGYRGDRADVVIPDGVTAIAGGAFAGHTELEHISIPAGVTVIGENAFSGCAGLTNIDIPASVTAVAPGALPAGTAVTYHGTAEQWDELAKDGGLDGVTVQFTGESGTPAHTHTWGEAYTNGGEDGHYRTCMTEGCSEHSEIVPHECTYTENGDTHTKTCTANCGYSKTEAHTWGVEYTDNGDGTHSRTCTGCGRTESAPHGYTYSDDSSTTHTMTCTECDYAKTEAHDYGGETYTDAGHVKKCTGCGHSETAQHIWGDTYENDGNGHYQICTTTGCTAHSATEEHTWSAYTDDHDGSNHSKTCSVCNRTEHAVHDWGAYADNGSGKHYQTCSVCHGQSESVAHTVRYSNGNGSTHIKTCAANCGYSETEAHTWGNETRTDTEHTKTCTLCAYPASKPHKWSEYSDDGDGYHSRTCSPEGFEAHSESAVHDWGAYTDDENGKHYQTCSVCRGQSKAVAHDYEYKDSADGTHTITCTKCEYANTEEHKYDNGTDNGNGTHTETCSACAATKTENHAYSDGTCAVCAFPKPKMSSGTIDDNGVLTKYNNSTATTVVIPEGVTGIGEAAFRLKTMLEHLTIPVSVTSIESNAFAQCTNLKTIYYSGTEEQWNAITKASGYGLKGKTIISKDADGNPITWTAK